MALDLLNILTSGSIGSVIGLIGSYITKREERKCSELQFQHELKIAEIRKNEVAEEYRHELAMADKQIDRAKTEAEIQQNIKVADAFIESQKESLKNYGVKWVDALRGLMRPIITIYLLIVSLILTLKIQQLVGGLESMRQNPADLNSLYHNVIVEIIFLTSTVVTWWFGSRPSQTLVKKR